MASTTTNTSNSTRAGSALLRCCLLFMLPALGSLPLQAQVQGNLFTTPAQRAYLDYLRTEFLASSADRGFDIQQTDVPEIPTDTAEQAPAPQIFTLGGIMARREGGHVIWLNGRSFTETELPAGISLQRNEGVLGLRFTTNGRARFIKPGQTIELGAGVVQEIWERPQTSVAVLVEATEEPVAAEPVIVVDPEPTPPPTASGSSAELDANMPEPDSAELQQLIEALQAMQESTNVQ